MPNKTQEYLNLAQQTAKELTRYWENWSDYLTTASRLYKYSFADQLMIYAQRPDATACADFDIWNNRMNRYVRRGSKGIALLDESSGFPRLHYVFDVSDTGVRRNSRDPEVWQYNDDLKQPVSEMLAAIYGISGERVSQQLADVAGKLVADYWDNNGGDIRAIVDGSLLMDYDQLCRGQQRHQAHHPRRCQHHRRRQHHPQPHEHELRHQALMPRRKMAAKRLWYAQKAYHGRFLLRQHSLPGCDKYDLSEIFPGSSCQNIDKSFSP